MLRLVAVPDVAGWPNLVMSVPCPNGPPPRGFRLIQIALLGPVNIDNLASPFSLRLSGGKTIGLAWG